jgi:hypothetical protein
MIMKIGVRDKTWTWTWRSVLIDDYANGGGLFEWIVYSKWTLNNFLIAPTVATEWKNDYVIGRLLVFCVISCFAS